MDAGRQLGARLRHLRGDTLVLGLARGGVPVAREVATALGAELDILVARKLGTPQQPEFGFGAVAPGVQVIQSGTVRRLGLEAGQVRVIVANANAEMQRRLERYRRGRPELSIAGRTVVVVDDGLATGVTATAALRSVRARRPAHLVFAAPVGPPQTVRRLEREADEVAVLLEPESFVAVGQWYADFPQVDDGQVLRCLSPTAPHP